MRALVVSIWVFINLVFFGMCGYMYLLWSQYWIYLENQTEATNHDFNKEINNYNRGFPFGYSNESAKYENYMKPKNRTKHATKDNYAVTIIKNSKPRFPNLQERDFLLDTAKYKCTDNDNTSECDEKILNYKDSLLKELRRVFMDESNILKTKNRNPYNVKYRGHKSNHLNKTPQEILCEFRKVKLKVIKRTEASLAGTILKDYLPKKDLFGNKRFNSCAIVASAGSLKNSQLGMLIDSHDLVLRFNHAPTQDFEVDVGQKTTMRIVNSQVITKKEFQFLESEIYRNITLLAWDPSNYTASVKEWYEHPEFNLFPNYVEYRRKFPKSRCFILNPRSLWEIWNFLQRNSPNRLRRNPPSSGFLGLAVLLPQCDYVDMYEYIPSVRVTKKCHYYDNDDNPACTFGVWHPLAAEKLLTYSLNTANDRTVFHTGYVRIPGFKKAQC